MSNAPAPVVYVIAAPPLAYNYEAAAAAVGVSDKVIRRAVADGSLVAHYVTARPVILADELRAWVESAPTRPRKGKPALREQPATPPPPPRKINGQQSFTAAEAAEIIGVHVDTVYTLRAAGRIGHTTIGTGVTKPRLRFSQADIDAYLASNRRHPTPRRGRSLG